MLKKSGIKIAKKYWPQVGEKLDSVIQYLNTAAGEGFASQDVPVSVVERYMGAAEVVGEAQPLPTTNVAAGAPQEAPSQSQPVGLQQAPEEPAKAVHEGNLMAEAEAEAALPKKVVNKVEELVKRARESGAWKAAHEYIASWPVDACEYATKRLKAAEYQLATAGE
ncbi:hypothetical protein FQZ97_847960 [compost metagenome]